MWSSPDGMVGQRRRVGQHGREGKLEVENNSNC